MAFVWPQRDRRHTGKLRFDGIFDGIGLVALVAIAFTLSACANPSPGPSRADERPQVVATSTIIANLTEAIAAEDVELVGLLPPGNDPHLYEPVPNDIKAIERADLILYNGFNLEPALIRLIQASGEQTQKLAVGEVVEHLAMVAGQKQADPHVWGDVENAIAMTQAIRDALIALSPEDTATFTTNAQTLTAQLSQLDAWITTQIATIPAQNRKLVTTHDAFQYYAHAYGLELIGTLIGISTEEQPSVRTVQTLVKAIRTAQIPAIFAETTINPQLIKTVAAEAGVSLAPQALYSDSIGAPGSRGDSYLQMMVANTQSIVESLGGRFTPFQPSP